MSFFKSLLPVLAGLGVGLLAPEALPLLGIGGGGAAGAVGAAGAGTGALGDMAAIAGGMAPMEGTAGALAAAAPTVAGAGTGLTAGGAAGSVGAAEAASSAAPMADPGILAKAGSWLGNHPEAALLGVGAAMTPKPPASPMSLSSPQIMSAGGTGGTARMGSGPPDMGFQQALMANLAQRRRMG